jgi:hypothetical protein
MGDVTEPESLSIADEAEIDRLCNLSSDELLILKGSSKLSGISLNRAKKLSVHLSLNRCFNKSVLIDNILKKRKRVTELVAIYVAENADEESEDHLHLSPM